MDKFKIIKCLIIILCLFFIYEYFNNNQKIIEIIYSISYDKILTVLTLSILMVFLYAYLMLNILRKLYYINIPTNKWLLIYFNSQFLNSIPFLGIIYRANQLKKFNLNYDKFFGIYMMINWFWLFLSLFLFAIETLFLLDSVYIFNISISIILLFLSLTFFLVPFILAKLLKLFIQQSSYKNNLFFLRLNKLVGLFLSAVKNTKFFKIFLLIFIGIHLVEFFVIMLLVKSTSNLLTIDQSYILFMGNTIIDIFNIVPQNLIVAEIGMGILTDKMNYDFELGVIIKLYLRFVVFFSSVFLAILYNIIYLIFNKKKSLNV